MKKFSIALMVLALCLISLAVSASTIDATAVKDANGVVTVTIGEMPAGATGENVVVIAMRDSAAFDAANLVSLKDATSKIVFVDQVPANNTVSFIPREDADNGDAITVFIGAAGADVKAITLVDGGISVGEAIGTDADAGFYMNELVKEYAISVTAEIDTEAISVAGVAKYGFCIYDVAGSAAAIQENSDEGLEAGDSSFAVIATGIPEGQEETEIFFKPYIIMENGNTFWGDGRAFSVWGLDAVEKDLGTLADVEALLD